MSEPTTPPPATATQARREEVLDTAADLFWARGYGGTALSEVAGALGMQKASLYHYVRTKESLLYELSIGSMHHILDAATSVSATAPLEHLRQLIERHVEALLAEQTRHATALTELRSLSPRERQHVTELRDRYDRIVEEAIRSVQSNEGLWPGVEPKLLRLALLGMLNWTVFWHAPGGGSSPRELAAAFYAIFVGGAVAGRRDD